MYSDIQNDEELLQGDAWQGLVLIDFTTLQRKPVSGIILSNSCDLDPHNPRLTVPSITFAPIVSLERYVGRIDSLGVGAQQRDSHVDAVKKQQVTSLLFLPGVPGGMPDSIANLGEAASHPVDDFLGRPERVRLLRLNDFGFFLFVFKLSIHFCRMYEGVAR